MSTLTLGELYKFSTVVQWKGRVNYTNMRLVTVSTYEGVSSVPRLVQSLESIRSQLPNALQTVNFLELEYLIFLEESYDADSQTGSQYTRTVIPTVFITGGEAGMSQLSLGNQPKIIVSPISRSEYNLVTGTLRDLDISFEISYS